MFEIQRNVPLASKQAYPFDNMKPGDSFFIPSDDKKINKIRAQLNNIKKRTGKVISTRKENDGLRVWLVKEQA
jgi:DUF4097 and DUF4098 domain-containing protein YvlB